MAILKASKIREMTDDAIQDKIEELELELAKEKSKVKVGGFAENPGNMREMRRTIARLQTIMHEGRIKNKTPMKTSSRKQK